MKKNSIKLSIALFLVSAITLSAILFFTSSMEPEHYSVSAKTISFSSLEEMEDYADIIVKVTRTGEEETVVKYSQEAVYSGYTFSIVKIETVYKDATNSLKAEQEIRILENEFFDEKENIVYHVAGYNMMEEGKEYLLFLNKHTYSDGKAYYVAAGINFGTLSVQADRRTDIYPTRDGRIEDSFEEIEPIWAAALTKYIK